MHTEEVNKIALNSDDDKRLQTFDGIKAFSYGANAFEVYKSKMMAVRGLLVENYTDFPFFGKIVLKQQR